jgi:hypothetical protein
MLESYFFSVAPSPLYRFVKPVSYVEEIPLKESFMLSALHSWRIGLRGLACAVADAHKENYDYAPISPAPGRSRAAASVALPIMRAKTASSCFEERDEAKRLRRHDARFIWQRMVKIGKSR